MISSRDAKVIAHSGMLAAYFCRAPQGHMFRFVLVWGFFRFSGAFVFVVFLWSGLGHGFRVFVCSQTPTNFSKIACLCLNARGLRPKGAVSANTIKIVIFAICGRRWHSLSEHSVNQVVKALRLRWSRFTFVAFDCHVTDCIARLWTLTL